MPTKIQPHNLGRPYGIASVAGTQTFANNAQGVILFNAVTGVNFDLSANALRYTGEATVMVGLSAQVGFEAWSAGLTRLILIYRKNGGAVYSESFDMNISSNHEPTVAMPTVLSPASKNDVFDLRIGIQTSGGTRTVLNTTKFFAWVL